MPGRVDSWLKRSVVVALLLELGAEAEAGVGVEPGGEEEEEVGEAIGEAMDGGVERIFRRSLFVLDLFI